MNPPDAPLIHSALYRVGPKQRELVRGEVAQMKKAGVAVPAITERASAIDFVPKTERSLCFCVDYRWLNAAIVQDSYPILRGDECVDSHRAAKLFSTLDANSGYWQIEIS